MLAKLSRHQNTCLLILTLAGMLGACATPRTGDLTLAELCAQTDLRTMNQRMILAGGYHALAKGDFVCAEKLTLDAHRKDPKDAYAALNLGAIYHRTGRPVQAQALYTVVLELDGQKSDSSSEPAQLATLDQQKQKRPAEIARHNLALLQR
jgi:Flp pilus assembly protein TadD